jgi:hypothetical protein
MSLARRLDATSGGNALLDLGRLAQHTTAVSVITDPHAEERRVATRLEAWQHVPNLPPSFATPAAADAISAFTRVCDALWTGSSG